MPKSLQYGAGSLIYFQGEAAERIFLLQSGNVNLISQNMETGEDIRDIVQSGEFFGVKSALGRFPREENAQAVQTSTLLVFSVPEFEALAMANTRIIMRMIKVFSNQLRRIHKQVSNMMSTKEVDNPEDGLFNIGERYLKNKKNKYAYYVFSKYLLHYPSGQNADQVSKYLAQTDAVLKASSADKADSFSSKKSTTSAEYAAVSQAGGDGIDLSAFSRFARNFEAGEMIFSEFEPGNVFYFIESGRVQLIKHIGEMEKTLDILQSSGMFGEMAILENFPRSATAIALDNVRVLEFSRQNFEILMMGNPMIALRLLKIFCKRIYDSKRRYMILTLAEPQTKVADVFLMLDEGLPLDGKFSERREFNINMDDVAHWAGMGVNEARNVLSSFANQHRIEIYSDRIAVRNINDFVRLVGSKRRKKG